VQTGSFVIYTTDPLLYGKLLVIGCHSDGRLICEQVHADQHGEYAREVFDVQELEEYDRWAASQVTA
jgi:hypothetical protein